MHPHRMIFRSLLTAFAVSAACGASAQVFVENNGTGTFSYTQNFDTLTNTSTNNLTDGLILAGWYASGATAITPAASASTEGLYSFGAANSNDRALGTYTNSTTPIRFGLQLFNNTGATIDSISSINFAVENYGSGGGANDARMFSYSVNASGLEAGDWTNQANLNITNPGTTVTGALASLNWLAGTSLWLRWTDSNGNGGQRAYGIDNFSLSAATPIPEPSTYALVFSAATLAVVGFRRFRKSTR